MNTQKSVFNKISKIEREVESKEVELSEVQKVEFALVDDAKRLVGEYADIDEDMASKAIYEAEQQFAKVMREYKALISEINKVKPKLEKAIQEIGINRGNFQVLDDLDEIQRKAEERYGFAEKIFNQLKSIPVL